MSTQPAEEQMAELLGQVRDMVSEYGKTLSEIGARTRRALDEIQHRLDGLAQSMEKVCKELHAATLALVKAVEDMRHRWPKYIKAEAEAIAIAQARECSKATMDVVEKRLQVPVAAATQVKESVLASGAHVQKIAEMLQWKIAGYAGVTVAGLLAVLLPLSMWWGSHTMKGVVGELARTQAAGYTQLQQLAKADLRECDVNGAQRLCLRIEPGLPTTTGKAGEVYAVVHGY